MSDRIYNVIPSAEKGLVSHLNAYLTPENAAIEATNIRVNSQYGSVSSREILVSEIDMGSTAITGLWRYYTSAGNSYTVCSTSTLLRYDAAGTATTIAQGLTDGKRFQFVTYKDKMIAGNGYNNTLKWDGVTATTANTTGCRTAGDLCAELGAPFATLITGTAVTASKWYQYRVAFYDGTTYSYSTARSNPILTGAGVRSIRLTDIPIGPTGTTHRYIYRSQANASRTDCLADTTYKMVYDVADNTTQAWTDNIAIGAEPDVPTWATVSAGTNVTPPKGSILEICTERLFVSGNTTAGYQSDVYWSDDGNPDYFLPSSLTQVRPDDGDKVTFLRIFLGILTIGKTNTIQKFYTEGDPTTDWSLSNPFSFVGCPAPFTAAVTPLGIFYLSRHGLYRFTGQSSELISDSVTREIEDISQVNIAECVGYYWNNEYHLAYTSESAGGSTNNRVLVYDIVRNAYVVDTKSVNCFAAFGSGSDYGTLFSGSSTTDGYVFAHSPTTYILSKRYKSELDTGTFSNTVTSGTEDDPILSMISLDNMESYTTDTLARASWVASETTASKKIPPDLGTGVDGAKTVSADETLTSGVYNYTSLTVDAGKTLIIPSGTILKVLGTADINGNIFCQGTASIYCHTFDLAASCYVIGAPTIRCNTLTNNGTITANMSTTATLSGSAAAADRDGVYNVTVNSVVDTTGTVQSIMTFTAPCNITSIKYAYAGDGNGNSTRGYTIYLDGISVVNYSQSGASSFATGTATAVAVYNNISSIQSSITAWIGSGLSRVYEYEFTAWAGTPVLDFVAGAAGTVSPTPAAVATTDYVYALDVYSDGSVKNEGNYSLKIVVPPGADTLNENVTKTLTAVDLSGVTYILLDVYALRSGTQMQLGLGEGSLTDFVDIPVAASNTWETVAVNISGIADANINLNTRIGIKFTNTDTGNVVYIDNIRPAITSGTWTSAIYRVDASAYKKLYWNENLNTYGDITWAIKTSNDPAMAGASWTATEYTNPNGSDISAETGLTYIQFRATLSTTDAVTYLYPWLYQTDGFVFRINYSKIGANYETSVSNVWKTGWRSLGQEGNRKMIKRVWVLYEGESEYLVVTIKGDDPNIEQSFTLDMSVLPDTDTSDRYYGTPRNKIYEWSPPVNSANEQSLISENFQFEISHSGDESFKINKMRVLVEDLPIY